MNFLQPATQLLSGIPADWIVIGCLLVLLVGFTMLRGTAVATALSLSLPVALAMVSLMQTAAFAGPILKQFHAGLPQALVFLGIEVILFILIMRAVTIFAESSAPFAAIIAGISATIVVLVIWMQVPSLSSIWHFSARIESVFGPSYALWWLLAAYAGIAFARS